MFKRTITLLSTLIILASVPGCTKTVVEADSGLGSYTVDADTIRTGVYEVYHLGNEAACGSTEFRNDNIDFEGIAGLKYKTCGTKVTFTAYTHTKAYKCGGDVFVQVGKEDIKVGHVAASESGSFDMAALLKAHNREGNADWYRIGIKLPDQTVVGHLYWDGKTVHTCRVGTGMNAKIEKWNAVVGSIDPSKCLEMWVGRKDNPITYPTSGQNGCCNHVDEWRALSHEIVLKDEWSDETKVFALTQWLARNCAYDDWRVHTNDNVSRANMDDAWTDDDHFMFYNHVGNCWDFANALTIMCREQGIPCLSVDNSRHTANAVWLNGEWVCVDVSVLTHGHCCEKNVDPDKWIMHRDGTYSESFGSYYEWFDTHNQGLCTPITATSDRANPL